MQLLREIEIFYYTQMCPAAEPVLTCILDKYVTFFSLDIDECLAESSGCEHYCVNMLGTYQCFCRQGFRLAQDRHSCTCE